MATEKRARKKEHRDAVAAQRAAELKRRRNIRLFGLLAVIAAVVIIPIVTGGDDEPAGGKDEPQEEAAVACDAEAPEEADPQQYDEPEQVLEEGVDYGATIATSCGEIQVDLLEEEAPITVNNFVFLAQEGYFDGLTWHRVVRGFVIQAGDPDGVNGQEPDGPGYEIEDELWAKANDYKYGAMAMANAGPNTGGSQFFIVVSEPRDKPAGLPASFSMFGVVSEDSYETLDAIAALETIEGSEDPTRADQPRVPAYIETVEITEN